MFTDTTAIRAYFAKLDLSVEIADLYLALHAHGPQSISQLSRNSGVERTRIYRLIDTLMQSNLIEVESRSQRGVIKAAPISNLHILITQKEQELQSLQDELGLIEQVLARNSLSSPAVRVQLYQGREGIRQMLWNELDAKNEIVGYEHRLPEDSVDKTTAMQWAEECKRRSLSRRIVRSTACPLKHTSHIYDNVVASYYWQDGDVYGQEIYNQEAADAQRQLFDLLWVATRTTVEPIAPMSAMS